MSKRPYVLDASALLAALNGEPGVERVEDALPDARIGAVNLCEVVSKLQERGVPDKVIDDILSELDLTVVPFTAAQAVSAGKLRTRTRESGLSLGDRACLALAAEVGGVALTTDGAWKTLEVDVAVEWAR